ncbi:hypothetical protein [Aneurinibacillus sp. REN35]|uniref:hypothetical protein n=1 Tax=Aneurinibacillus sp. REN35 TaxID=3237286 RepID=UPI003529B781
MNTEDKIAGQNIAHAMRVVLQTYHNLAKLFEEMDRIANEEGYVTITPRFLRHKSDVQPSGWLTKGFIKLYQVVEEPLVDSEKEGNMRKGCMYGVRITLAEEETPKVAICRYEYEEFWEKPPSVSEYWIFSQPLYNKNLMSIREKDGYIISTPLDKKAAAAYKNLHRVIYKTTDLVSINSEEAIRTVILKEFHNLRSLTISHKTSTI